MAKEKEKRLARGFYVNEMLNKKQIAERLEIHEKTVSRWIKKENWDDVLVAKIAGADFHINDLKASIIEMVRKRLDMNDDPDVTAKDKAKLTDEISKINKALETAQSNGKPSLTTIVHVTESFMNDLKSHDPDTYFKLLDFHVNWLKKMAESNR